MNAILYGNLSVEVASLHGVRIARVTQRHNPADLLQPRDTKVPVNPRITGREEQALEAFCAIRERRPIAFYSDCGYGKTTLLQHIAARAAEWYGESMCVFLPAAQNRAEDILQQLVAQLYCSDRRVKLTAGQCAQLLGQSDRIVVVDDAPADPAQVGWLLEALPSCTLVIGAVRQVPVGGGSSHNLPGLPDDAALLLLADGLGRPLTGEEMTAAPRLAAALDGQPLHLNQAAALVREGRHSLASLASQAEADRTVLDRLCISALTSGQRRALAVLAFAAGVLLPAEIVDVIGQAAELGECLELLHQRGLAEQRDDRFGLPTCKAESYRAMLLGDLKLGASAGSLGRWLTARDAEDDGSWPAAEAALAIIEFAAERKEWAAVIELTRAVDKILFIAARWQALHQALHQGLAAAKSAHDSAAEAYFSHQLGSLELCLDHLGEAAQLLQRALALREEAGDNEGADFTRQNLRLLGPAAPPPPPPPPNRRVPRLPYPVLLALSVLSTVLALFAGAVAVVGNLSGSVSSKPGSSTSLDVRPSHSTSSSTPSTPSSTPSPSSSPHADGTNTPSGSHSSTRPRNTVKVPSVIGLTRDQATSTLASVGLFANPVLTTTSCGAQANGSVVSQSPAGGAPAPKDSTVAIGICVVMVTVPNVIGQTQDQASATLAGVGLSAIATNVLCPRLHIATGNVGTQNPASGLSAPMGSNVTIGICRPPVPSVTGEPQDQATSDLTNAGLIVSSATTANCDPKANGTVLSQEPAAGTPAVEGADAAITVCAFPR
jgi:beta-lactam-binding protein with PASTA domain